MTEQRGQRKAFELVPNRNNAYPYLPAYDWFQCVMDLKASGIVKKNAERDAELHFANARLTFDGRTLGFVDSVGGAHPVPASAAAIRVVRDYLPTHVAGKGSTVGRDAKRLVLLDAAGSVVLRIPDYGWHHEHDVARWAAAAGLSFDTELVTLEGDDFTHPDRVLPGYADSPMFAPGNPLRVKRWWGWAKA